MEKQINHPEVRKDFANDVRDIRSDISKINLEINTRVIEVNRDIQLEILNVKHLIANTQAEIHTKGQRITVLLVIILICLIFIIIK